MQNSTREWKKIIWREWRYCHDFDYEERLFKLVGGDSPGWGSRATLIFLNAAAGAALAVVAGFALTLNWIVLGNMLWAGALVGGFSGVLAGRHLTWEKWLTRLQSNSPTGSFAQLVSATIVLALVGGMIFGPLAWVAMAGLFWAFGGLITWINNASDETEIYRSGDRRWWFWWRGRPRLQQVEAALRAACEQSSAAREIWAEPLRRLDADKRKLEPPELLVNRLLSNDWVERFTAAYRLVLLGPVAEQVLFNLARNDESPLQPTAQWLLDNINTQR